MTTYRVPAITGTPATDDAVEWNGSLWVPRSFNESAAKALTTKGDLLYANATGTTSRLPIGTTGQVLTESAGAPAWATPAGGGSWSKIERMDISFSTTSIENAGTLANGKFYALVITELEPASDAGLFLRVKVGSTLQTSLYQWSRHDFHSAGNGSSGNDNAAQIQVIQNTVTIKGGTSGEIGAAGIIYFGSQDTLSLWRGSSSFNYERSDGRQCGISTTFAYRTFSSTISKIRLYMSTGNISYMRAVLYEITQ